MSRRAAGVVGRSVLCAALGLLTTIAVAWIIAFRVDYSGVPWQSGTRLTRRGEESAQRYLISLTRLDAAGATHYLSSAFADHHGNFIDVRMGPTPEELATGWAGAVVMPRLIASLQSSAINRRPGTVQIEATGWPFRALWCEYDAAMTYGSLQIEGRGGLVLESIEVDRPMYKPPYPLTLPARPLAAGLLADSAIFASAWCLLLFGPVGVRRVWRRRRGACVRCGYDLSGGLAKCPECGDTARREQSEGAH